MFVHQQLSNKFVDTGQLKFEVYIFDYFIDMQTESELVRRNTGQKRTYLIGKLSARTEYTLLKRQCSSPVPRSVSTLSLAWLMKSFFSHTYIITLKLEAATQIQSITGGRW